MKTPYTRHLVFLHRAALAAAALLFVVGLGCGADEVTSPPPPPPPPLASPAEVIEHLRAAYVALDYAGFAALFPADGRGVDYTFILDEPDPVRGEQDWGLAEELEVHRRMFDPTHPLEGENPVPAALWVKSIAMSLTPSRDFEERPDFGLAPPWRAWEAAYHPNFTLDLAGSTDYHLDGRVNFIVIEDTSLPAGSQGKFFIYRWEDLGHFDASTSLRAGVEASSWSRLKCLYRR
jgi:hypothetical protein